jgi:hypothetical protein
MTWPRVNQALASHAPSGTIFRCCHRAIARAGKLSPDIYEAANLLGLSLQVPATVTYLTDGPKQRGSDWAPEHSFQTRATEGHGGEG